jgi:hypothetical protein
MASKKFMWIRSSIAVSKLEQAGVALGHPASSAIKGASFALRELRIKSSGHALRVFYAFDPRRDAVLTSVATRPVGTTTISMPR